MYSLQLKKTLAVSGHQHVMQRSGCASNSYGFVRSSAPSLRSRISKIGLVSVAAPVEISPEEKPVFEVRRALGCVC